MTGGGPLAAWRARESEVRSLLRIGAALIFLSAGTMKLFAVPVGVPPAGGHVPYFSEVGLAGLLELVGGFLLVLGLFTRPVAFVLAVEMAVAYFQVHFRQGFWTVGNGGMPAALFALVWLYFSVAGAGRWSLDALRRRPARVG